MVYQHVSIVISSKHDILLYTLILPFKSEPLACTVQKVEIQNSHLFEVSLTSGTTLKIEQQCVHKSKCITFYLCFMPSFYVLYTLNCNFLICYIILLSDAYICHTLFFIHGMLLVSLGIKTNLCYAIIMLPVEIYV